MIGIIGAMEVEVVSLCQALTEHTVERHSGTDFHIGKLEGREVVIARCGIGKVAAAVTAEAMLLLYKPTLLLNTGVAGALSEGLSIGDLVISSCAIEYDMDTSPLGDPVGLLSGINIIRLPAEEGAVSCLWGVIKKSGCAVRIGTVASGDRFVASSEEKARILSLFPDAAVCEMEGAAIAHTAYLNDTPFVILRAVSDTADGHAECDYPTFVAQAAQVSANAVVAFVKSYTA